jgi:hypothetical protein
MGVAIGLATLGETVIAKVGCPLKPTHFSCNTHIDPKQVAYGLQQSALILHPHSAYRTF